MRRLLGRRVPRAAARCWSGAIVGLLPLLLVLPTLAKTGAADAPGGFDWSLWEPTPPAAPLHDCLLVFRFGEDRTVMPTMRWGEARDVNSAGMVAGWLAQPDGALHATLWDGSGVPRDLGTLGGRHSCALGLNDAGQVVGWSDTASGPPHAFVWSGAGMVDLGADAGQQTVAFAISDEGTVVGLSWPVVPLLGGTMGRAVGWDEGAVVDLHAAAGTVSSAARSVSDDGSVVGWVVDAESEEHGARWNPDLGFADLGKPGASSEARAINASGQVAGWTNDATEARQAIVWDDGEARFVAPGSTRSVANDVNDRGVVAGAASFAAAPVRPMLWTAQGPVELDTLGGQIGEVYAVNDAGTAVGWAQTANGAPHPVLWQNGTAVDLMPSPSP